VDFTIEVERALRVLDGAILVLCSVSGVQSQTLTVDRQMKRYNVPRLAFINKLDRMGANPQKALNGIRSELKLAAEFIQLPIGLEHEFIGVIDVIAQEAIYFQGDKGETVVRYSLAEDAIASTPLPQGVTASHVETMQEHRASLLEKLVDLDDEMAEMFLQEITPSLEQIQAAIRRLTISCQLVPVLMGSAMKNKGIQCLLQVTPPLLP
jgi:elongation factor G